MLKNPEVLRDIGVHVRATGSPIYCRNHHLEPLGSRAKLPAVSRGALRKKSQAMNNAKQTLRNRIRARRQALPPSHQHRASRAILKRLSKHPLFLNSQHIAFYLTHDGEVDPQPLMQLAHLSKKHCYLPVIKPDRSLGFVRYRPGTPLIKNRYGIAEPCGRRGQISPQKLDIVIMPLVAFDRQGGRLGMGGGFYDRSFQAPGSTRHSKGPVLLGLGHAFQEVAYLELEDWDVKLAVIATEKELIRV
jgi:5-formyltetrahydrofolate cyclo-ligase